jgi:rSAM/selenodomain-associated transferase 1
MLLDTVDVARNVTRAEGFIAVEPADALDEMQALVGGAARVFPQRGEMLGDRMRNAFATLSQDHYSRIVMIGSDLPTLPAAYIEQAFDSLGTRRNAIVIGPASDGGYYLIGLRAQSPELFDSIPWSTPDVLAATLDVAKRLGLSVSLTPTWYDVDGPGDLQRVMRETAGARRTRAWIAAHDKASQLLGVQD